MCSLLLLLCQWFVSVLSVTLKTCHFFLFKCRWDVVAQSLWFFFFLFFHFKRDGWDWLQLTLVTLVVQETNEWNFFTTPFPKKGSATFQYLIRFFYWMVLFTLCWEILSIHHLIVSSTSRTSRELVTPALEVITKAHLKLELLKTDKSLLVAQRTLRCTHCSSSSR